MNSGLSAILEKYTKDIFELLIKYYEGNISIMKLAEKLGLSFSQTKIYLEKIENICKFQPKSQKVIAEGKVFYWSTTKAAEAWLGKRDDGFAVKERLVSKLYRYRGKNIKLIVEIVEEKNAKNKN